MFNHQLKKSVSNETKEIPVFDCLGGKDVITAKVSDHHPVLHMKALFWNVLMKCNKTADFNNGFGIEEKEHVIYQKRLKKVALVIAEIIYRNPHIETIGLCEGPLYRSDIAVLIKTMRKFLWMRRFRMHYEIESGKPWGLITLIDKSFKTEKLNVTYDLPETIYDSFKPRLFLRKLEKNGEQEFFALGHVPFPKRDLSEKMQKEIQKDTTVFINQLLSRYVNEKLTLCADFNFHPYLLGRNRMLDKVPPDNSVLFDSKTNSQIPVTVDGILLSNALKNPILREVCHSLINLNLFAELKAEKTLSEKTALDRSPFRYLS